VASAGTRRPEQVIDHSGPRPNANRRPRSGARRSHAFRYKHRIPGPSLPAGTFNVSQVRERYGVSMWVVYYWIDRGLITAQRKKPGLPYAITLTDATPAHPPDKRRGAPGQRRSSDKPISTDATRRQDFVCSFSSEVQNPPIRCIMQEQCEKWRLGALVRRRSQSFGDGYSPKPSPNKQKTGKLQLSGQISGRGRVKDSKV